MERKTTLVIYLIGQLDRNRTLVVLPGSAKPSFSNVSLFLGESPDMPSVDHLIMYLFLSHSYNMGFGSCDKVAAPLAVAGASPSKKPLEFIIAK
jgi:hypothetical protein